MLAVCLCALVVFCLRHRPPARIAAIQNRVMQIGVRRLQAWTVGMLDRRKPDSEKFLSASDIPDDIGELTRDILFCDDPQFYKGREHAVFVIRGGHVHEFVRIGRIDFVPYVPENAVTAMLAPGVWVEVEK